MTYYIYHIPGKKIGVTCDLEERVTKQQGYEPDEYEVLGEYINIDDVSAMEIALQKEYGYEVDRVPYNKLKYNNKNNKIMDINVTEQTTTFPCPVNKLKGQLMDNIGMEWETEHGRLNITNDTIDWIMRNIKESMYNNNRCYIYNKAFSRYYDNNDPYDGKTIAGALSPTGADHRVEKEEKQLNVKKAIDSCGPDCECLKPTQFDLIREWATERGLYDKGDPKTQYCKLIEEAGELGRAILKEDIEQAVDAVGDMVVVLTNFSELIGVPIETCIKEAYETISKRKGKMINGTFVKDE